MQASRRMLAWEEILNVLRSTRKRAPQNSISHYFGYQTIVGKDGAAKSRTLMKFVRYVTQEGVCPGCHQEFPFSKLTIDHIEPKAAGGKNDLTNVQLMCSPCNNRKGATLDWYGPHNGQGRLHHCTSKWGTKT